MGEGRSGAERRGYSQHAEEYVVDEALIGPCSPVGTNNAGSATSNIFLDLCTYSRRRCYHKQGTGQDAQEMSESCQSMRSTGGLEEQPSGVVQRRECYYAKKYPEEMAAQR